MSCGDIFWWRTPNPDNILQRHGAAEHLVIQFDFLSQAIRNGRAEYSIPEASKKTGGTGFADIVSLASGEIWEIKPEHLVKDAVDEAQWYVSKAKKSCPPPKPAQKWVAGESFTTSGRYGVPGLVLRLSGGSMMAELYAKQGPPGAVLYKWYIDGKEATKEQASEYGRFLRNAVIAQYYPYHSFKATEISKEPNAVPPGRFVTPVLAASDLLPGLRNFHDVLALGAIERGAPQAVQGGAVAICVESAVFDALVSPGRMNATIRSMQTKPDPTVELYRHALNVVRDVPLTIWGIIAATLMSGLIAGEAVVAAGALGASAPVAGAGGIGGAGGAAGAEIYTFSPGFATAARITGKAAGVLVFFFLPRSAEASGRQPPRLETSTTFQEVLTPAEAAQVQIGMSRSIAGREWKVVGIARAPVVN